MTRCLLVGALLTGLVMGSALASGGGEHGSRLSEEPVPLQLEGFPQRPRPILELGSSFLGTGTLGDGVKLPGGAVWQPQFLLFGTARGALQFFDRGDTLGSISEVATRLDLFGNLALSGSERLVVGIRGLDQEGRFTSYVIDNEDPDAPPDGYQNEFNADIRALFFEGDFGELFPNLSKQDFHATDYGFSIGRQALFFQEGMLINDTLDAIGVTRNTLMPRNTSNFRMTFLAALNDLHRTVRDLDAGTRGNIDSSAKMFAFLTSTDLRGTTMDVDMAYVFSDDDDPDNNDRSDMAVAGISFVQRMGQVNGSFRVLSSFAVDEETDFATDGTLLFGEVSLTPHKTVDLLYFNGFWAIDDFSSAARDPSTGGPLGRAGISFAAVGLGQYGAPLSNQAREVAGGAIGYQKFLAHTRQQLLFEIGARIGTDSDDRPAEDNGLAAEPPIGNQYAGTVRYQLAFGKHFVVVVDAFAAYQEFPITVFADPFDPVDGTLTLDDDTSFGGRTELVFKF